MLARARRLALRVPPRGLHATAAELAAAAALLPTDMPVGLLVECDSPALAGGGEVAGGGEEGGGGGSSAQAPATPPPLPRRWEGAGEGLGVV